MRTHEGKAGRQRTASAAGVLRCCPLSHKQAHLEAAHKRGLHLLGDGGGDGAQRLPARHQRVLLIFCQQWHQGLRERGAGSRGNNVRLIK